MIIAHLVLVSIRVYHQYSGAGIVPASANQLI